MLLRETLEQKEIEELACYACFSKYISRKGVSKHRYRTEFQRDRDRIIHSKAFRRLEYKTQVFLTRKGDHLRARLTHSLEVAQLSRTIAIQLKVNSDLAEAIALGHDVGHTPFGHAGERVLSKLLAEEGIYDFKHNVQSIRIFELLEKKYPYEGIRLTIPVKEGILKHTDMPSEIPDFCKDLYVDKPFSVTLEGQIVAIADEIAQITHDMDDYLRYHIIDTETLSRHEIFDEVDKYYNDYYGTDIESYIKSYTQDISRVKDVLIRCLVDFLVTKLIEHSEERLKEASNIKAFELDKVYIDFKDPLKTKVESFHKYLKNLILSDYRIKEMDERGGNIIRKLFYFYKEHPNKMPEDTYEKYKKYEGNKVRVIADYISGMTDRYAIDQYDSIIDL